MRGSEDHHTTALGYPVPNPHTAQVVGANDQNIARRAQYASLFNYIHQASFDSFRRGQPRAIHGHFDPLGHVPSDVPSSLNIPTGGNWNLF